MALLQEPEFWVAIGFVIVVGILLYVGVPKMVATMLDARAAAIKGDPRLVLPQKVIDDILTYAKQHFYRPADMRL